MKTIHVQGRAVAVSDAVYRAYWQERERERYQQRVAQKRTWSESDLAAQGVPADSWQEGAPSAEACVLEAERRRALSEALATLNDADREFIWQLVLGERTERALAGELGLSRSAVHKRRKKILSSLKETLVFRS